MREWLAIVVSGCLGGAAGTLFAERVVPVRADAGGPPQPDERIPSWLRWVWGFVLNMAGGALAAFVLWATYTSSLTFDSRSFTPSEVAAAITVGFGGVGAVRGLMNVSQRADSWKRAAEGSAETAQVLRERQVAGQEGSENG